MNIEIDGPIDWKERKALDVKHYFVDVEQRLRTSLRSIFKTAGFALIEPHNWEKVYVRECEEEEKRRFG